LKLWETLVGSNFAKDGNRPISRLPSLAPKFSFGSHPRTLRFSPRGLKEAANGDFGEVKDDVREVYGSLTQLLARVTCEPNLNGDYVQTRIIGFDTHAKLPFKFDQSRYENHFHRVKGRSFPVKLALNRGGLSTGDNESVCPSKHHCAG
jgi:hypothetical protein